jgi:hypothetical protein
MTPIPIEGPAVEPVTVSEMRGFLRLDDGAEDALVADLIRAARLRVEVLARRVLLSSRWRLLLDRWPLGGVVALPIGPVLAIEAVRVIGASGAAALVAPALYDLAPGDPARLVVDAGRPEPSPRWRASRSIFAPVTGSPPATCRRRWSRRCAFSSPAPSSIAATARSCHLRPSCALLARFRRARL